MKLSKISAATSAALLMLGLQGQAHADAVAQSRMLITDFILTDGAGVALDGSAAGGVFVDGTLSFSDNLTNSANLNGTPDAGSAIGVGFQASVDAAQACVGAPCVAGPNAFGVLLSGPGPAAGSVARADSLLTDVPLSGVGFPVGANASTLAETGIAGTGVGGSSSDIILNASLQFQLVTPVAAGDLGLRFNADTLLRAWTSTLSTAPTQAGASFTWTISLADASGNLIDWRPDGSAGTGIETGLTVTSEDCDLNDSISAGANNPADAITCNGGFAAVTSIDLAANTVYSLVISQTTRTTALAQTVPEPTSVALMGIALAGFGAVSRKRKAKQA